MTKYIPLTPQDVEDIARFGKSALDAIAKRNNVSPQVISDSLDLVRQGKLVQSEYAGDAGRRAAELVKRHAAGTARGGVGGPGGVGPRVSSVVKPGGIRGALGNGIRWIGRGVRTAGSGLVRAGAWVVRGVLGLAAGATVGQIIVAGVVVAVVVGGVIYVVTRPGKAPATQTASAGSGNTTDAGSGGTGSGNATDAGTGGTGGGTGPAVGDPDARVVPNLRICANREEMRLLLAHVDLVGAFAHTTKPTPSRQNVGRCDTQHPAPWTRVWRGSTVRVTLFGPHEGAATVPDLQGMDAAQAARILREAGLSPRPKAGTRAPTAPEEELVYAQSPSGGAPVPADREVAFSYHTPGTPGSDTPGTELGGDMGVGVHDVRVVVRDTSTDPPRVLYEGPETMVVLRGSSFAAVRARRVEELHERYGRGPRIQIVIE